jgi:translocation and assembly module TamB
MDLSIEIPARFFVRGRGLDAEFKGQLTAKGPANNPVIRGTLNVVRGTFQLLTRTFHITDGQIAFDGARPPVPFLNVTTQVTAGQIDAIVQVSGPADDFKLTLTSQPPLPQDEIMANILFGQSVAKLNAFQAYQLAASISQLSGGGMPDVVGKTRTLLGVDRLSFSSGDNTGRSDDREPTVSAGKYVSEDVYVGVEQDLTDAKQDVVVEVDITPNFSVKSRAGTRSGAGVGFNWRYDY